MSKTSGFAMRLMEPSFLSHDPSNTPNSCFNSFLKKSYLHSGRTVVIVIRRFIQNFLHSSRKNSVLTRFPKVSTIFVVTRNADMKDLTHKLHSPFSIMMCINELIALMSSYFFRRCAKKPRASCRISLACFNSAFSFSSCKFRLI